MTLETQKYGNDSELEVLKAANWETLIQLLPLIITMTVLGIVGLIGNIVTARFYGLQKRKTPTKCLIMSLAMVDIIVCVLFAPSIAEMYLNVLYTSPIACKTMHFLGHWSVESSYLILGFIAIDRYSKICGRSPIKITKQLAKRVVIIILAFSCIMSVRDFVTFDVVPVNVISLDNSSAVGHYCTNTDDPDLKLIILVFYCIDAFTFFLVFQTILLCYIGVSMTLYKTKGIRQHKLNKEYAKHSNNNASQTSLHGTLGSANNMNARTTASLEKLDGKDTCGCESLSPTEIIEDPATTVSAFSDNAITFGTMESPKRMKKIQRSERNITFLMIAVSSAFVVCASPYLAIRISFMSSKRASDLELDLLTQFGLKLCYINSVINPLIYCLFNPSFRKHMKKLLKCGRESVPESNICVTVSEWY